jgi:hypothetical protein
MATRDLTYDEKKAAEAAFRGLPLNPSWSAAAKDVYEGIMTARQGQEPSQPLVVGQAEESAVPEEVTSRELAVMDAP